MVRTYRQRRKRKRNITIGSNGLPINVRNLPFTDELRIQCEILEFWYLNPHLSYRQSSGDLGVQNGAPHKVSRSSLRRLVKWFQCYGEPKCLTDKTLGRISGRKKMTSEQQLALKAFVLENPELYLDEIQIHPSTMYQYLKRLGLSLNSLTAIASVRSEHLSLA